MQLPLEHIKLTANTVRTLAMDAVQRAKSGHPGMPMGMADVAVVLWSQFLNFNPQEPDWPDRDRFVLSAGHGSMLLYALLHISGYDLPLEELKNFRQWDSRTPGHPEYGHTVGVETTTGPLGQGISNAVGMALAEKHLAATFNRDGSNVVDHYTYVIASDGDLMEGVSHESSALAGHLQLGKLIVYYDDNKITIDGSTDLAMTEDVLGRYSAYGWHVQACDGHDMQAVYDATVAARAASDQPSLIACRTHIGFGSPNKQDTAQAHGEPLGEEEIVLTKKELGWTYEEPFAVPEEAIEFMRMAGTRGIERSRRWQERVTAYAEQHSSLSHVFGHALTGKLPEGWEQLLPTFEVDSRMATRASSSKVLDAIVPHLPSLVGGAADLTGSNKTWVDGMGHLQPGSFAGRYISYGVREHAMGSIMNGMSVHGGIRPYGGTFLVFSDYMRPTIRLAALMKQPVIYVFTHDSIGLGEDGPTHQPIEHLMSLRAIPGVYVIRPADANETSEAWRTALGRSDGPIALVLTRQSLPTLPASSARGARHGGYVLRDVEHPQAIIMATGSEVEIALNAQDLLAEEGIATRVVSLPCWELFDAQPRAYRDQVLPPHITARVSIEAGRRFGWEKYVGQFGTMIGIDHFGASAPFEEIYEQFGLTAERTAAAVRKLVA